MAHVAVLGVGGVGVTLAALMCRAGHTVTCVIRPEKFDIFPATISVVSDMFGEISAIPRVTTALVEPCDLLLIATKAYDLRDALQSVHTPVSLAVPLLNGWEHMEVLKERFGNDCVAAGALSIEAVKLEPGVARHSSPFIRLVMGADRDAVFAKAIEAYLLLKRAGIDTRVLREEKKVIWGKLVRLCVLSCMTTLVGEPIGEIMNHSIWRSRTHGLVREAVAVSCAVGVPNTVEQVMEELYALPPKLTTSLARDIAAKRPSELDAIAGGIVRAGESYGLDCPSIRSVIMEIKRLST